LITFCPLASGSKGNAVLLKTPAGNILFDAGISAKNLNDRLSALNCSVETIQAIVISHEHSDHIAGLKTLAFRYQIPIIANYATAEAIVESLGECPKFHIFTTGDSFEFLNMQFTPFSVQHDGVDPVGFTVKVDGKKIGLCTDIGFVTPSVRHFLQNCHLLYLEANHDPSLVHASSRPEIYKRRVLSRTGHLSNEACAQLIADVAHNDLRCVYLAHLSSECNTPERALRTINTFLEQNKITVSLKIAHQHQVSESSSC
jgi:phosphoribosyl 1,2-cyclic phosphodiesterase